jgi:hypothetical protein
LLWINQSCWTDDQRCLVKAKYFPSWVRNKWFWKLGLTFENKTLISLLFHQTKLVLKLSWINQFSFWKVKLSQINLVFQNLFKATSLKPDLESSFWFCKHF